MAKKKKEKSASPKLGARYQATKLGVQVVGPLAYVGLRDRNTDVVVLTAKQKGYWKSNIVAAADYMVSRKIRHAGALSRKSVSAWAPEVYALGNAAVESNLDPEHGFEVWENTTTGGSPADGGFFIGDRTKLYYGLKYGGWLARKALGATRLNVPVNKFLNMLGVTL